MQEQLNNLERGLGRVEGKIDGILAHLERMNGRLGKHDVKIDTLEIQMSEIKTKATIYGGIAGTGIMLIWQIIKDKIKL